MMLLGSCSLTPRLGQLLKRGALGFATSTVWSVVWFFWFHPSVCHYCRYIPCRILYAFCWGRRKAGRKNLGRRVRERRTSKLSRRRGAAHIWIDELCMSDVCILYVSNRWLLYVLAKQTNQRVRRTQQTNKSAWGHLEEESLRGSNRNDPLSEYWWIFEPLLRAVLFWLNGCFAAIK